MPADRLRQRRLETGVDMLGIDEAHRHLAGQRIEERLDRRRAAQRGGQQPDLARRLANHQRRIREHLRQLQARWPLRLGQ
ncbi:hypothetical protein FQZ97_977470 [compost metagenome]